MKYIWLIGGSVMAEPMCKEIKRRGYKLLLIDQNPACHCRPLADMFREISVYDVEANLMAAYEYHGDQPVAVLTIGTDAGPTVSALSEFFGLPGIGRGKAERVKNKIAMRQALGLVSPYFFVHYAGDHVGYFEPDKFPLAVKAPGEAGSRGFDIARNNDHLHQIVAGRDGDLLFEQLLVGHDMIPEWREKYGFDTSEAAFDFFVDGGQVIYANGALRMFWADQPGLEAGHINPFDGLCRPEDLEQITALAQMAADRLGLDWGVLKIDVKKDERYGWCLLECATRLSGGFDHMYTSPLATGRDVTGVMLDVALGQRVDRPKLTNRSNRFACCLAPRYAPGLIDGWSIGATGGMVFPLTRGEIRPLKVNQDRPIFIIRVGGTPDGALRHVLRAAEFVAPITSQKGANP